MAFQAFQVFQPAGVGQAIEIDQQADFGFVNDMMDQVGANKPGAARDEQIHGAVLHCCKESVNASSTGRMVTPAARSLETSRMQLDRGRLRGHAVELLVASPKIKAREPA